jgi:hypothetical protein
MLAALVAAGGCCCCKGLGNKELDNWGCGEVYHSEWHNDPPDCCDPCDCWGNYTGPGCCTECRSLYPKKNILFSCPCPQCCQAESCCDEGCEEGCDDCGHSAGEYVDHEGPYTAAPPSTRYVDRRAARTSPRVVSRPPRAMR